MTRDRILLFVLAIAVMVAFPGPVTGQGRASISGRIVDQETEDPVGDAEVRLLGLLGEQVTNEGGVFRFQNLGPGTYRLEIKHLAYGIHTRTVEVEENASVSLQIGISQAAIELEPLNVEVFSADELRRRASGIRMGEVTREQLDQAALSSTPLGDVLTRYVPSVRALRDEAMVGSPVCIEFRGARFGSFDGFCRSPAVYLDGIPLNDPLILYDALPLEDIERMEVVPPAEAGVRFGSGALWGALVIETRRPGIPAQNQVPDLRLRPSSIARFDWGQEPAPHNWKKAFAYSLIGNALGLAVGVAIADQCIEIVAPSYDKVSTKCAPWPTMGSAIAGVSFPAAGAAFGARLGGRTDMSQGSFLPAAVAGVMALIPGYALQMSSARSDFERLDFIGKVILTVGVPAAITFTDRLFRKLRPDHTSDLGDPGFR